MKTVSSADRARTRARRSRLPPRQVSATYRTGGRLPDEAHAQGRCHRSGDRRDRAVPAHTKSSHGGVAAALAGRQGGAAHWPRSLLRDPVVGAYHRTRPAPPIVWWQVTRVLFPIYVKALFDGSLDREAARERE